MGAHELISSEDETDPNFHIHGATLKRLSIQSSEGALDYILTGELDHIRKAKAFIDLKGQRSKRLNSPSIASKLAEGPDQRPTRGIKREMEDVSHQNQNKQRDYENSKRRRYANEEPIKEEPKDVKPDISAKNMGPRVAEMQIEALRERSKVAETSLKNTEMENKEFQKKLEAQMKQFEELKKEFQKKSEDQTKQIEELKRQSETQNKQIKELETKCEKVEREKLNVDKENRKQGDSITLLEKEKLVLEKEKEDELSTYKIEIE